MPIDSIQQLIPSSGSLLLILKESCSTAWSSNYVYFGTSKGRGVLIEVSHRPSTPTKRCNDIDDAGIEATAYECVPSFELHRYHVYTSPRCWETGKWRVPRRTRFCFLINWTIRRRGSYFHTGPNSVYILHTPTL